MYICKDVLTKEECKEIVKNMPEWEQGRTKLNMSHKNNQEIREGALLDDIKRRILSHETINKYSFIKKMTKPRFNKYEDGGTYAPHIDFFQQEGIRTDWSLTMFLTEPESYEGGELVIELPDGEHSYKLPAGSMILYPSGNIHGVRPVTKGKRIAAIAWAQSHVEDAHERNILSKLVDVMSASTNKDEMVDLSFVYNNLLRKWSK